MLSTNLFVLSYALSLKQQTVRDRAIRSLAGALELWTHLLTCLTIFTEGGGRVHVHKELMTIMTYKDFTA